MPNPAPSVRCESNAPIPGEDACSRDTSWRRHVMEGNFADAANNHGSKRARWRGLARQKIQSWLICAAQNLRILIKHAQRWPQKGAATLNAKAIGRLEGLRLLKPFHLTPKSPARALTLTRNYW